MKDEKKLRVGLRVTREEYQRLQKLGKIENWSLSKIAEIAVRRYLDLRRA